LAGLFLFSIGANKMNEILQYLKTRGERLDSEIAEATGIPIAKVRLYVKELTDKGDVMSCHSTRFEKGKKIEGIRCRISGFIPPAAPGRKSKAQLTLS
jgi:transcription initiation factor IIE alpha subunit